VLFVEGEAQYKTEHFAAAYELFKRSCLLFPAPELLYNMASSLQGAGKPHEADEALRSYLRARPDAPDRADFEGRIRALEEAQRLLDAERALHGPPPALVAMPSSSALVTTRSRSSRNLAIGLGTTGALLVVGGLAVGLTLGLHDWHSSSSLNTHTVTP